jgi:hypothetical protein
MGSIALLGGLPYYETNIILVGIFSIGTSRHALTRFFPFFLIRSSLICTQKIIFYVIPLLGTYFCLIKTTFYTRKRRGDTRLNRDDIMIYIQFFSHKLIK